MSGGEEAVFPFSHPHRHDAICEAVPRFRNLLAALPLDQRRSRSPLAVVGGATSRPRLPSPAGQPQSLSLTRTRAGAEPHQRAISSRRPVGPSCRGCCTDPVSPSSPEHSLPRPDSFRPLVTGAPVDVADVGRHRQRCQLARWRRWRLGLCHRKDAGLLCCRLRLRSFCNDWPGCC